jgi:hypothetical protein
MGLLAPLLRAHPFVLYSTKIAFVKDVHRAAQQYIAAVKRIGAIILLSSAQPLPVAFVL